MAGTLTIARLELKRQRYFVCVPFFNGGQRLLRPERFRIQADVLGHWGAITEHRAALY